MKKLLLIMVIAFPLFLFAQEEKVGYLGVTAKDLSEAMKIAIDVDYGVLVEDVSENSPAEKANIKIGDVIMAIDGQTITNNGALKEIVEKNPNKKVKIVINRQNKTITREVTLDEKEKTKVKFEMEVPTLPNLRDLMGRGTKELEKKVDTLKEEVEQLKKEIEELKKKIE